MSSSTGDYLPNTDSSGDSRLDAATLEYLRACEEGNPPKPEEFIQRYPEFADQLREFFVEREKMEELVGPIVGFRDLLGSTQFAAEGPVDFGDFELIREIGRGGMGVIYEARHKKLNRIVALKMVASHGRDSLQRFQAEAEAVATLEHPNIVPIYQVGNHDDRPYFTMKLVGGGSLKEMLADGPLDARPSAAIAHALAEAIHYAHQRGVLHRDLKPANILIDKRGDGSSGSGVPDGHLKGKQRSSSDSQGSIKPMISDFGLAKRLDHDDGFTMTGAMLGTPSFMSPEQANGSGAESTTATDIYGVGAILYNMLTGRPPFTGNTQVATTLRVINDLPDSIRKSNSKVDLDLETICYKCLEKEPQNRYESASLLAEDLSRYLQGKPIHARRAGAVEQVVKWARRKPAIASLLAVVALSGVALIAGLLISNRVILAEKFKTEEEQVRTKQEKLRTQKALWQAYLNEARGHRENKRGGHQSASLAATRKAAELSQEIGATEAQQIQLRSEYIADLALPVDILTVREFPLELASGDRLIDSFDDQLTIMSSVRENHEVVLHDVETGEEIRRLQINAGYQAQPSPNGEFLVADEAGTLEFFFCRSDGTGPVTKTGVKRLSANFTFGPESRRLFVNDTEALHVFDLQSGRKEFSAPLMDSATSLRCSSDGSRLCATNTVGEVLVVESDSGNVVQSWRIDGGLLGEASFSPDGKQICVAGGYRGNILLFDVASGREITELKGKSRFMSYARFDASGKYVIGCDWSLITRIWHVRSGELELEFPGVLLEVSTSCNRVAFREESGVRVCELRNSPMFWHERGHEMGRNNVLHVNFHSRLPLAVSGGEDGVRIINTDTQSEIAHLPIGNVTTAAFHPVDGSLVTWGASRLLRWPLKECDNSEWLLGPFEKLPEPGGNPDEMAISRNGKSLAASYWQANGFVIDWDDRTKFTRMGNDQVSRLSLSPDGSLVAFGNWKGHDTVIRNTETGKLHKRLKSTGGYAFPRFSPCGRYLAVSTVDEVTLYDAASFEAISSFPKSRSIPAFNPDGTLLAKTSESGDGTVEIYDVESKQHVASLVETTRRVSGHALSIDPSGRILGKTCGVQGTSFWRLDRIRSELAGLGIDWDASGERQGASRRYSNVDESLGGTDVAKIRFQLYEHRDLGETYTIDLASHTNHAMSEDLTDKNNGYCFESMPRGAVRFEGTPFQIGSDLVFLDSTRDEINDKTRAGAVGEKMLRMLKATGAITARSEPIAVRGIRVGDTATKLHFLHNLVSPPTNKTSPVRYKVHYADGTHADFDVVYRDHISQCGRNHLIDILEHARIAWSGQTSNHDLIHAVSTTWTNPHPEKPISEIHIVLDDKNPCKFVCLAITGER